MNRFATLLTGAALLAAQTVFAQMGSPDAPPVPGMPAVAGPLYAVWLRAPLPRRFGLGRTRRGGDQVAVARPDPGPMDTEALAIRERGNCIDTMRVTR